MRILVHDYVGHAFPTDLSRELARRGHTVVHAYASNLITPRGPLTRQCPDPDSLSFHELDMDRRYIKWKYSFIRRRSLEIKYGRTAARFVGELRPDVVLSGNTPTDCQRQILAATHAAGAKFVSWVQDFYGLAVEKLLRKKFGMAAWPIGAYYRRMDRSVLVKSDLCIGITQAFYRLLQSEGVARSRIEIIPNWAAIRDIPVRPKANPWSTANGLDSSFVYLYSGTLGLKHNPALLLNLAKSMRSCRDVQVVVVSEGIGADWLREQKRMQSVANLQILNYAPFNALPDLLATGDVLLGVLEPEASAFSVPSKVLSYLCAARPILLSVEPDNLAATLLTSSGGGIVTPPGDESSFLTQAKLLYQDHKLANQLGSRARSFAEATFDITRITDSFESAISTISRS